MIDFQDLAYKNLVPRLKRQASNVGKDGHLNAERLILNAVHILEYLEEKNLTTTEERIIALLHDVVEDTDYDLNAIYAKFGSSVGAAIFALSRQSGESYPHFIERVSNNALALKVKIADLTDNLNLGRLKEITDEDLKRVKKYAKARSKLIGILEAKESSTN